MRFIFFCIFGLCLLSGSAFAESSAYSTSGLPLPRFVSLSKNEVNVRSGPGEKYPIKWVFSRKAIPVEVILEFDHWRKIRDHDGQEGWVYHTLLSGKRTGLILGEDNVPAYEKFFNPQGSSSRIKLYLEPHSRVDILACKQGLCMVSVVGYKGWVERKSIWGVYEHENFD